MDNHMRYKIVGKPGDWEIWLCKPMTGDKLELVDRVSNRGHALSILKGLENPRDRKVRYTFRKVYRFLNASGWSVELNEPPDVYWRLDAIRVKENRLLGPRALLLLFQQHFAGNVLHHYWTWTHHLATLKNHGT
jgi:hypothetical protein